MIHVRLSQRKHPVRVYLLERNLGGQRQARRGGESTILWLSSITSFRCMCLETFHLIILNNLPLSDFLEIWLLCIVVLVVSPLMWSALVSLSQRYLVDIFLQITFSLWALIFPYHHWIPIYVHVAMGRWTRLACGQTDHQILCRRRPEASSWSVN